MNEAVRRAVNERSRAMKILMVNKFLYPNGGSETYTFQLGRYLEQNGHFVEYFGMEHPERCVGNTVNAYTSTMDFHKSSGLAKLGYAFKTVYSIEARKKLRLVLDNFQPDVIHLNNFNYQLTPSMIVEIIKWEKESARKCKIIYTAHDFQLVCPNHQLFNPNNAQICEKCLGGGNTRFLNCTKGKCIHGSSLRSLLGSCEAYYWNTRGIYRYLDAIICPSQFMKEKLDTNPLLASKTVFLRNFTGTKPKVSADTSAIKDLPTRYVLYFGRFSVEKGIGTLLDAVEALPDIPFVFAGNGPLLYRLEKIKNVLNVGFLSGDLLNSVIQKASFSIIPSEWYENCPYSVIESLMLGTPVLGARIGGIPELIQDGKTGELFQSGNAEELKNKIRNLWDHEACTSEYRKNCEENVFDSIAEYTQKLMQIYTK